MQPSSLNDSLTIIIITSPVPSQPSTELIDRLVYSLRLLVHGPDEGRKISVLIVCDGVRPGSKKTKRQAELSDERRIAAYDQYKERLVQRWGSTCLLCGCRCSCGARSSNGGAVAQMPALAALDVQVTQLDGWHGFGLGLRHALTLVRTPHAMVLPHDMEFTVSANLPELCAILAEHGNGVEYIGFANPCNLNYPDRVRQKSGVALLPSAFGATHTPLLPLWRWKENPHIANVAQYAEVVFGPKVRRESCVHTHMLMLGCSSHL